MNFNSEEWEQLRRKIFYRDNERCFICKSGMYLTVHHIKARADGGTDDEKNLITLCYKCHDKIEGRDWDYILSLKSAKKKYKKPSKKELLKYGKKIDMYRYLSGELIKIGERYEL